MRLQGKALHCVLPPPHPWAAGHAQLLDSLRSGSSGSRLWSLSSGFLCNAEGSSQALGPTNI